MVTSSLSVVLVARGLARACPPPRRPCRAGACPPPRSPEVTVVVLVGRGLAPRRAVTSCCSRSACPRDVRAYTSANATTLTPLGPCSSHSSALATRAAEEKVTRRKLVRVAARLRRERP